MPPLSCVSALLEALKELTIPLRVRARDPASIATCQGRLTDADQLTVGRSFNILRRNSNNPLPKIQFRQVSQAFQTERYEELLCCHECMRRACAWRPRPARD